MSKTTRREAHPQRTREHGHTDRVQKNPLRGNRTSLVRGSGATSIVAFRVGREPGMPVELRVGFATVHQLKGSGAVGIQPGGDNRRLRGSHVVRCIVKKNTVSSEGGGGKRRTGQQPAPRRILKPYFDSREQPPGHPQVLNCRGAGRFCGHPRERDAATARSLSTCEDSRSGREILVATVLAAARISDLGGVSPRLIPSQETGKGWDCSHPSPLLLDSAGIRPRFREAARRQLAIPWAPLPR